MGNEAELKAKELVDKFDETLTYLESKQKAKRCALIAVYEILQAYKHCNSLTTEVCSTLLFYNEVKQEIEKL